MYLDERSAILLKEILSHLNITSMDLQARLNLTRRQIDYSFNKINSWLEKQTYPKIHRSSNGQFVVEPDLFQLVSDLKPQEKAKQRYIPSEKERISLIILMLVASTEKLSLNHFIFGLSVSKNTVLNDLKLTQNALNKYQIDICYFRKTGYQIKGDEWRIRTAFIYALEHIMESFCGELAVSEFTGINTDTIEKHRQNLEQVEEQLKIRFIDKKMRILPYILETIFRRIKKNSIITADFLIDYTELSDTREYNATEILIGNRNNIPQPERFYITLQLLISNVLLEQLQTAKPINKYKQELRAALVKIIDEFEKNAVVVLQNKDLLLERLYAHIKPAYYRIKYKLATDYTHAFDEIDSEFNIIHFFIKQSLKPLEEVIGTKIPDNESMLIALFFGGHLIEINENFNSPIKAVIVCSGSLSILRIMDKTLRSIFPEIMFYPAMSARQFEQTNVIYDVVFTTIPIYTSKTMFVINQVMNEKEQYDLRCRVMRTVYNIECNIIGVEELMRLIDKYTIIQERKKLERAIVDSLASTSNLLEHQKETQKNLAELLTLTHITKTDSVETWHDSIRLAAQPLLNENLISQTYVEAMISRYPEISESIVLRLAIAIPHAEIEKGANQLCMSLLHIKQGIGSEQLGKLHFVVVIAATDRRSHFTALLQLMELANDRSILKKLHDTTTSEQLYQEIQMFVSQNEFKLKQQVILQEN